MTRSRLRKLVRALVRQPDAPLKPAQQARVLKRLSATVLGLHAVRPWTTDAAVQEWRRMGYRTRRRERSAG